MCEGTMSDVTMRDGTVCQAAIREKTNITWNAREGQNYWNERGGASREKQDNWNARESNTTGNAREGQNNWNARESQHDVDCGRGCGRKDVRRNEISSAP